MRKLDQFSPEIFLPLFVLGFYLAGLVLVDFSPRALGIVAAGILAYLVAALAIGRFIDSRYGQAIPGNYEDRASDGPNSSEPGPAPHAPGPLSQNYFERLLLLLVVVFVLDLLLKNLAPLSFRAPLYLVLIATLFYYLGRRRLELSGAQFFMLGFAMILLYVVPSFALYGLYGSYLNRTGGLMPAFLVGMGTITTVYGLMKGSSKLSERNLYIMIALITFFGGPFMAAIVGYRAYAIIYIMPLVFLFYLERRPPKSIKAGALAIGVVALIFVYTYFATSVARGTIYMAAPLADPRAPEFVVASMEKGRYTDKDMNFANSEARTKVITRPLFTYKVFLDVIDSSYPWGKSHGKLTLSLMPGVTKGRSVTISILKKPLSTSFFGLPFLEFGFAGVVFYSFTLGACLAVASRLKDKRVYALILTIVMLWLDTGPSVWWHWLPFASSLVVLAGLLRHEFINPKVTVSYNRG